MPKLKRERFDQIIQEDWGFIRTKTKSEPAANYTLVISKYTSFAWDLWISECHFPKDRIVRYQLLPKNTLPEVSYTPVDGSNFEGVLEQLVEFFCL